MLLPPHSSGCHAATILHPMQVRGEIVSNFGPRSQWVQRLCPRLLSPSAKGVYLAQLAIPITACGRSDSLQDYPRTAQILVQQPLPTSPRNGKCKLATVASSYLDLTLRSFAGRTKEEYSSSSVIQTSLRGYAMRRMSPKVCGRMTTE